MTPIAHHWLDSTHVSFGVITAGFIQDDWKVEVSRFTGREPDQFRFNFDAARFRLHRGAAVLTIRIRTLVAAAFFSGWLKSPEQLDPDVNEQRLTASATWFDTSSIGAASPPLWRSAASNFPPASARMPAWRKWNTSQPRSGRLFARAEAIESTELVPSPTTQMCAGPANSAWARSTIGPSSTMEWRQHWKIGLGGLYAFDFAPSSTTAPYGRDPHGAMGFVRLLAE